MKYLWLSNRKKNSRSSLQRTTSSSVPLRNSLKIKGRDCPNGIEPRFDSPV